jgi:phosphatidylglycerol lysyltransferase
VFVTSIDDRPVGFLVASPVALRNGWLVEQIVRGREAPNGTAELMLDAAQRHMAALESTYVTLGLSPISRHAGLPDEVTPLWLGLLLRAVRAWGTRFYNFQGLDAFKSKFRPERWEVVYAIAESSRLSLAHLYAASSAFAGGAPLRFFLQALRGR